MVGIAAMFVAGCLPGPTPQPTTTTVPPGPTPSAAPITSPSPTVSTPPPAAVDAAAWYPVGIFPDDGPQLGLGQATAVTTTWFGFLAVGSTPRGGTSWWSPDGTAWTAAFYDDPALRGALLTGVAASDSRIVAIGMIEAPVGTRRPAIWSSPDGLAWTLALELPADTFGAIRGVVYASGSFVAVGTLDEDAGSGTIWTSSDGVTWSESTLADGYPLTIVNGPAGALIAGGRDEIDAAWLLDRAGQTHALASATAADTIAGGPTTYWAVTSGVAFRSADGETWTNAGNVPSGSGEIAASVVQRDGSLVIATRQDDDTAARVLLRTRDGSSWEPVRWPTPLEPEAEITALAEGQTVVAAVGSIGERRAAIWVGQPAAGDAPGAPENLPPSTACPDAATWTGRPIAVLAAVLRLSSADRVRCLHETSIRVSGFLGEPDGLGGLCEQTSTPEWLTGGCPSYPRGWLQPVAASYGRSDNLGLFSHDALAAALRTGGHWIVVTGHFDDPLSTTCRDRGPEPDQVGPIAASVEACRAHFVVTKATPIPAPTLPSTNPDPAAFLGLPGEFLLAPAFEGWDNLTLPSGTTYGFREVTPPGGIGVTLAVFRVLDPGSAPAVETALIGDAGPSAARVVLGVDVARTSDGSEAIFVIGTRIFRLQVPIAASGPTSQQAQSLETVVEALIRAASAG
jgi:hypothetical protein